MFLKLLIFHLLLKSGISRKNVLNIGGILDAPHLEEILRNAISEVNSRDDINFKLNLLNSTMIIPDYPFYALTDTCNLLKSGPVGIFGPISSSNIDIVQSVCDAKEIPLILTHPTGGLKLELQVNFFPNPKQLTSAYVDIITNFGWEDVTVLYVNPQGLSRLSDFIEKGTKQGLLVYVERLDPKGDGNYRSILRKLRDSARHNFILDQIEDIHGVLLQMQQIGMLIDEYNYFLTDVNVDSTVLERFSYGKANIIGVQFVDPEALISSESALITDAMHMFSNTLKNINITQGSGNLDCNNSYTWKNGYTIVNFLKSSTYTGLTGLIEFDTAGHRNLFQLYIFEICEGIRTIRSWNSSNGLSTNQAVQKIEEDLIEDVGLRNRQLVVIIALTEPYAMLKRTGEALFGNDRYEGFVIDLISELALITGFNYTFIVRQDNRVGHFDPHTGGWRGMLGDLINGKADLAVGDLTITSEREEAVDFTPPFITLGISILYHVPSKNVFSFADTFTSGMWMLSLAACIWTAASIFVLGRISSSEWTNPYPCKKNPEHVVNELDMASCLWFVVGSVTQQGSGIKLRSVATRIIAAVWWLFAFLMVSLYVANLASILIGGGPAANDFSSFHDLVRKAEEKDITYGAKSGGATANFFREQAMSNPDSAFAKAWAFMESHNEGMVATNTDGIEKARQERYAFFMESSSLEYVTQRSCNLQQVGDVLDSKGYGIAMRKNSSYRGALSSAILRLLASGKIDEMKRKWWSKGRGVQLCSVDSEARPLDLHNLQGVFWLTFWGTILAFILAVAEALFYTFKKAARTKTTFKKAFKEEFKFYFLSRKKTKPAFWENHPEDKSSKKFEEEELGTLRN